MANRDLGALILRLKGDSAQLVKELQRSNRNIEGFGRKAKKVFGTVAAGLVALGSGRALKGLVTGFAETADEAAKLGRSLGTTTERITAYSFAAERAGLNQKELETGLRRLTKTADDAGRGLSTAVDAFDALGVNVRDNEGNLKSVDVLLADVADGLQGVSDATRRAAIAQNIFGRSGTGFVNLLGEGSEGLQQLTDDAARFGAVISDEAGAAAEAFQDALTNLNAQATGLKNAFGTGFIQSFTPFLQSLAQGSKELDGFVAAGEAVADVLKTLAVAGSIVKNAFDIVGDTIGGVAAAVVAAAKGEFSEAKNILSDLVDAERIDKDIQDVTDAFEAAFAKPVANVEALNTGLEGTQQQLRGVNEELSNLEQNEAIAKQKKASEEAAKAAARFQDQLKARAEALKESVRTPAEILAAQLAEIDTLAAELPGILDPETYNRLADSFQNEFAESVKGDLDSIAERAEQIKGNLKSAFGQELTRIAEGNFSQIGQSFAELIQRMLIDAASSELTNIFGGLLGGFGEGGLGGGGAAGFLGSLFGGFRANGGPVGGNRAFMVGEKGPELFVPGQAGNIVPSGGAATVNVVNNFSVSAPNGRIAPESQQQLAAKAGSAVQRAVNRNR